GWGFQQCALACRVCTDRYRWYALSLTTLPVSATRRGLRHRQGLYPSSVIHVMLRCGVFYTNAMVIQHVTEQRLPTSMTWAALSIEGGEQIMGSSRSRPGMLKQIRPAFHSLLVVAAIFVIAGCERQAGSKTTTPPPLLEVLVAEVIQQDVPIYFEWIGT